MASTINSLKTGRIVSIDAFRGLTFVAMIFVNGVAGVSGAPAWLKHMPADADAMSFADVVFPAFLFIVGMAIPFSTNARLAQGDDALGLQRHILYRAFALIVMGLFMVNAEGGFNAQAMPVSMPAWSLLFYLAVFLAWGVMWFENPAITRAMRLVGASFLLLLALLYRGGADGSGWMTPQWWGILGLIGWAYLFSSELYLLSRGRLVALSGFIVLCVAYYALANRLELPPAISWLFSQHAHAAHSQIVLAGVVCSLIFFDGARADSSRRRFARAALFALVLALAATGLRPWFPISKIDATPSWCLYTAAMCVAAFAVLYWIVDLRGHVGWTRLVEPAASSPLVTYLIPFVVAALLELLGLALPAALGRGAAGLLWAAVYAALVVWAVSWLNRRGVRLKL